MDRFVAPQFIDVEDRIIGPITTRQFVMMVIGGVIVFLSYKFLDSSTFVGVTLVVVVAVLVFGFIKINGRRFSDYIASMIQVLKRPKIRVWYKYASLGVKRTDNNKQHDAGKLKTDFEPSQKTLKTKHLSDLALLVDTGGKYKN